MAVVRFLASSVIRSIAIKATAILHLRFTQLAKFKKVEGSKL